MSLEAETYGSLEEFERANESQTGSARRRPVCDRCGRELGTGLPSPCSRCATFEEQARAAEVADDVMPCGCSSGSCYCDDEEVSSSR